MKLTQNEVEFFKSLSTSEAGRVLMDYLRRVVDHVYDSRSWTKEDSKESAAHAARLIQELVIDKIRPKSKEGVVSNSYE